MKYKKTKEFLQEHAISLPNGKIVHTTRDVIEALEITEKEIIAKTLNIISKYLDRPLLSSVTKGIKHELLIQIKKDLLQN